MIIQYSPELQFAKRASAPIVALESTIIAHGLPYPENLHCALRLEAIIREQGAVPATIAVLGGKLCIGLDKAQLEHLAQSPDIAKLSRRDMAWALATHSDGATTVASTMLGAHLAGIKIFATGGIGGVHRGAEQSFDISADITELGQTPVAVVCAGAKSILDLPKTLELLETQGVPVLGYGCDEFPAFYQRSSGLAVSARIDTAEQAAKIIRSQELLGLQTGIVIAAPIPETDAIAAEQAERWIAQALQEADKQVIQGKESTPFLLARIAELSQGQSLKANLALVENNTRIAAQIALELGALECH